MKTRVIISLPQLKKKTQRVVNKYVRMRDQYKGCISCGKPISEAGHYIAQGSSGLLRFDERNLNGQCVNCNRFKHGNLIEYRLGLIKRIGEDEVEDLENHRHEIKKWTREELEDIIDIYKVKIKSRQ